MTAGFLPCGNCGHSYEEHDGHGRCPGWVHAAYVKTWDPRRPACSLHHAPMLYARGTGFYCPNCHMERLGCPVSVDDLYWEDCCHWYYAAASIAQGDGYWPSMISVEFDCEGTITSDDARGLAAMLVRAADACDASTDAIRSCDCSPTSTCGEGDRP